VPPPPNDSETLGSGNGPYLHTNVLILDFARDSGGAQSPLILLVVVCRWMVTGRAGDVYVWEVSSREGPVFEGMSQRATVVIIGNGIV
jgi:hypothetical protein